MIPRLPPLPPLPTSRRGGALARFARRFDFKRLHASEGGNVMVMYIAAALILVGMLWAIIGTGARVVQKETLQSSADAAAFSAAVIKAKGMNVIAFCNLLMALLLAIIIILRLLKDALILAGILLTVAAFFQPELAGLAAEVDNIASRFANVENKIETGILKAMNGISKFERGIAKVTPALALVEAWRVGTNGAYQKNMSGGTLVTIALPLPVGQDLSLPTKDGTWDRLCFEARHTIDKILEWVISKVVGDTLASWVSKAFGIIASPFESAVCGGGGGAANSTPIDQVVTDCGKCASGAPSSVMWSGTVKGGAPQQFRTGGFPGDADCSGSGFASAGVTYDSASFVSCVMKQDFKPQQFNTDVDKPLPLELADDFAARSQVRAFTVLAGTRSHERRVSVGVARRGGAGGDPIPLDALMTMAQAEFTSWNSNEDLWHMDYRARLVPFSFGSKPEGGKTGDSTGEVPGGALTAVQGALTGFLNSETGQTLTRQFLVH